jgi:hypothetical protein
VKKKIRENILDSSCRCGAILGTWKKEIISYVRLAINIFQRKIKGKTAY